MGGVEEPAEWSMIKTIFDARDFLWHLALTEFRGVIFGGVSMLLVLLALLIARVVQRKAREERRRKFVVERAKWCVASALASNELLIRLLNEAVELFAKRSQKRFYTFISYTTREYESSHIREIVREFAAALEARGLPVSESPVFHDGIFDVGGANLERNLRDALSNSLQVSAFLSPLYFESKYCMIELNEGPGGHCIVWKVCTLPLRLDMPPEEYRHLHPPACTPIDFSGGPTNEGCAWALIAILASGNERLRRQEDLPEHKRTRRSAGSSPVHSLI